MKPQKKNASVLPTAKIRQEVKMDYWQALEMLMGMSEEERTEAFAMALGMLNEDELADMIERCSDIIEAVQMRLEEGETYNK